MLNCMRICAPPAIGRPADARRGGRHARTPFRTAGRFAVRHSRRRNHDVNPQIKLPFVLFPGNPIKHKQ
ncbi:hypothetical protein DM47_1875 [Burkholderia mallei]|nr:hypothetical protein DM75_2515 [Burkholderia mallei]KOS92525.1 hypothetical protein DM49_2689 [Burkholderia mallei]KOT07826.1 hypothetical protein DM77_2055 [Burkholderia mallei]KOT18637.1 hypothetical protein DM47_1875 [Burkholderia mallei]